MYESLGKTEDFKICKHKNAFYYRDEYNEKEKRKYDKVFCPDCNSFWDERCLKNRHKYPLGVLKSQINSDVHFLNGCIWSLINKGYFDGFCLLTSESLTNKPITKKTSFMKKIDLLFPKIKKEILENTLKFGNRCIPLGHFFTLNKKKVFIYSFPTLNSSLEEDLKIIEKSCKELLYYTNKLNLQKVLIPKINSKYNWPAIKEILIDELDHRFYVISE